MITQVSPESATIAMLSRHCRRWNCPAHWLTSTAGRRLCRTAICRFVPAPIAALVAVDREAFVRTPKPAWPGWAKSQRPTRLSLRKC